ncbi:hypothetical protein Pth03_04650 [Planotetraspora thailandica]|uniref:AB hydrolase-1 domain-containing protein n=1 Tax=Planotetraspora thailandica TaxID=487172 RepID=A0A8J3UWF6_9ACTN|nr:hypothetical protein Pth03_04650 [Planotetraspora thailandica]
MYFHFPEGKETLGEKAVELAAVPVNADTWSPVSEALRDARVVDLPGLGMSRGRPGDWPSWLAALVTETGARHLVGHSVGAAAALEMAVGRPDLVGRLTLVSPFFLQARAGLISRWAPLARWHLRRIRSTALAKRLTGDAAQAAALQSSVADLRYGGTAANVARLLADSGRRQWRRDLQAKLRQYTGRLHVVVGADDPLTPDGRMLLDALPHVTLTVIAGAGHHPQLTHPREVAQAIQPARRTDQART